MRPELRVVKISTIILTIPLVASFLFIIYRLIYYNLTTEYPQNWPEFVTDSIFFFIPVVVLGIIGIILEFRNKNVVGYLGPLFGISLLINIVLYPAFYGSHNDGLFQDLMLLIGVITLILCYLVYYKLGDKRYETNILGTINKYAALIFVLLFWSAFIYSIYTAVYTCPRFGDMCPLGAAIVMFPSFILAVLFSIIWIIFFKRQATVLKERPGKLNITTN